jgi:hypothetical protein
MDNVQKHNTCKECYCFSQLDMYGAMVGHIICWISVHLIFVLYTVMSVGQSINYRTVGWLMNNCWKGCRREWLWSNLKYYSGICLEGLIWISLFPNHDHQVASRPEVSQTLLPSMTHFLSPYFYIHWHFPNFCHFYSEGEALYSYQPTRMHDVITMRTTIHMLTNLF